MVDLLASIRKGANQYSAFNTHNANQANIKLKQQEAEDQAYRDAVNNLGAIALDNGYSSDGVSLNRELLEDHAERSAKGEEIPSFDRFSSLVLNTDLAKNGKISDFRFTGVTPGPDGTITAEGQYEDGTTAPLTEGRSNDPNDLPAFASPKDAVGGLINQFDELRYDPRFAQQNIDSSRLKNVGALEGKKIKVKGQLTASLVEGLRSATANVEGGEKYVTAVKAQLAQMSPDEQLAFMRDTVAPALGKNIKEGLTEEQAEIVDQAGNEPPTTSSAPTEQTGFSMSEQESKTDAARLINKIETDKGKVTGSPNPRSVKVDDKRRAEALNRRKTTIEKRLSNFGALEDVTGFGANKQVAALQAELELINRYQSGGSTDTTLQGEAKTAVAKGTEKTASQIAQGDTPQFTEKELSAFQEHLASKGITSLAKAYKATDEELLTLRSIIATTAKDAETRKMALEQFDNVIQTGNPGFNAVELSTARLNTQNAATSAMNAETSRRNSLRMEREQQQKYVGKTTKSVNDVDAAIHALLWDKENSTPKSIDLESFDALFNSNQGPKKLYLELQNANQMVKRNGNNRAAQSKADNLRRSLLANISLYMQVINKDGSQEWSMETESGAPLDAGDAALNRVQVSEYDGAGNPVEFIITKPADGTQDDDAISASTLKNKLGATMYDWFVKELGKIEESRKKQKGG